MSSYRLELGMSRIQTSICTERAHEQSFNNPDAQDFTFYAAPYDQNTALVKPALE